MTRILMLVLLGAALVSVPGDDLDLDAPFHRYRERTPQDRFSKIKRGLENGTLLLDRSSELAFLGSLLKALEIPPSSQMLVFSTTSLQLSLINPRNPRALYFNEDTYVGFIPGGKIELISLDPELGAIFHIFDVPRGGGSIIAERSGRCMNCHSGSASRFVPGLVIMSVVPGPTGGSLDAFRSDESGHAIPFADRFGGWYLTGAEGYSNHWANIVGRMSGGEITRTELKFGERFNTERYPRPTSDLLAHLLHEHQAGFVNRVVEGSYRARALLHRGEDLSALRDLAREITRYLLFADEVPLPVPVTGDSVFKCDFRANRRMDAEGRSLKDFDLSTRLFKHRCSYMIYSPVFTGLPSAFKEMIFAEMHRALSGDNSDYDYLSAPERGAIRSILDATLPGALSRGGG